MQTMETGWNQMKVRERASGEYQYNRFCINNLQC